MTTTSNGVAKKQSPATNATEVKPQPVVVNLAADKQEKEIPPLEDRILRLNQLFAIQGKYDRLNSSLTKLEKFKMKKGEENIKLSIFDTNTRESFDTSNPEVIAEVMDFVKQTIIKRRKAIEPLLVW